MRLLRQCRTSWSLGLVSNSQLCLFYQHHTYRADTSLFGHFWRCKTSSCVPCRSPQVCTAAAAVAAGSVAHQLEGFDKFVETLTTMFPVWVRRTTRFQANWFTATAFPKSHTCGVVFHKELLKTSVALCPRCTSKGRDWPVFVQSGGAGSVFRILQACCSDMAEHGPLHSGSRLFDAFDGANTDGG
jgi:hypothetical protein